MFAVLSVALRNLQRRLLQSVLVATVVALSVLLFFAGFGLMKELNSPFERMFEAQRGSHLTLDFDSRVYDTREVQEWWRAREEVVSVTEAIAQIELDGGIYHGGQELNSLLYVAERPASEVQQDDLVAVAGSAEGTPGAGEVWVPTSIASEADLEVGDDLEIPTFEGLTPLRVSAIVVDPQYSAPFNNPKRIWIGEGQLPRYFALADLSGVELGVRLKDASFCDPLWDEFLVAMGGDWSGRTFDYQALILGYTAPYSAMAAMLVAFSLLSVLIALFAMHGTLTSAILADFRTIGLLRAQGFTPRQVGNIYRFQYMALALVAIPVGIGVGIPLVRRGVALLMSTTGTSPAGGSLSGLALLTFVFFAALVWLFVGLVARRAGKIRPSEAIRFGTAVDPSGKSGGPGAERLAGGGVPLIVAVKNLAVQKRRALLLVVSVVFATLAGGLAVNLDYSFRLGAEDPSLFGFDDADVRVLRAGRRFPMRHDTMMKVLTEHNDVAHVASSDFVDGELLRGDGEPAEGMLGTVIAGDIEALKHRNLEGRNPASSGEVSVGINTAREYGIAIGDTFPLFIAGQELPLEVTGLFQSLNNGGTGFRILLEALRVADPLYEPVRYGVVLRDGVDPEAFITALEGEYGEAVDGQPGDYFIRRIMSTVLTGMRISNGFLAGVFLLAASVFIFSSTLMNIAENRRLFGILKAVGMTPLQLRASVLIGVALLTVLGICLGLLLWMIGAGAFLSLLFSGLGLVAFPLQTSFFGTAIVAAVILAFCLLSGWWPTARLLDLDPRSLIVE